MTRTASVGPAGQEWLSRRLLSEGVGTGLLTAVVVGSGIAAQRLSPGELGLELLENSIAGVFGLAVLIVLFGPISWAHFNPITDFTVDRALVAGCRSARRSAGMVL